MRGLRNVTTRDKDGEGDKKSRNSCDVIYGWPHRIRSLVYFQRTTKCMNYTEATEHRKGHESNYNLKSISQLFDITLFLALSVLRGIWIKFANQFTAGFQLLRSQALCVPTRPVLPQQINTSIPDIHHDSFYFKIIIIIIIIIRGHP